MHGQQNVKICYRKIKAPPRESKISAWNTPQI